MYAVAARLDPDSYYALARATYREMVLGGHHHRRGVPLPPPRPGRHAVRRPQRDGPRAGRGRSRRRDPDGAARHLLPRRRHRPAGRGRAAPVQRRHRRRRGPPADASALHGFCGVSGRGAPWPTGAGRGRGALGPGRAPRARSPSSPPGRPSTTRRCTCTSPSRSPRTTQCLAGVRHHARPRCSPRPGALGSRTTAVHATHLTDERRRAAGRTRDGACFCPTTERDLGDGIGPSRALHDAGAPLTLGSDSHAVIDLFEEMRAVELDERLATRSAGTGRRASCSRAATDDGHRSLGLDRRRPDRGRLRRADLVTLDTRQPRTAGTGAGDRDGGVRRDRGRRRPRRRGRRGRGDQPTTGDDVGSELDRAIRKVWRTR